MKPPTTITIGLFDDTPGERILTTFKLADDVGRVYVGNVWVLGVRHKAVLTKVDDKLQRLYEAKTVKVPGLKGNYVFGLTSDVECIDPRQRKI